MTLVPVAAVKAHILKNAGPLGSETVSIYEAHGRVMAQDIRATLTQPPFDASAMDGYAIRADDAAAVPATLRVTGASAAGHGFAARVRPGEAVRIFTGAPLPEGADTIVIQENTEIRTPDEVAILEPPPPGNHIRARGYDFKEGDVLIAAGTKLGSRDLMLAAAANHAAVPVRRRPIVAVLANGDELVPPGTVPRQDQIVSSIPAGMKAAVEAWGGEAQILPIAKDDKASLAAIVETAGKADILVTIGGASVGEHDLVRVTLEEQGARFEVLKAAMRPGKPVMFGLLGAQRVLSLPGNPASAIICALIFLKPLIKGLLGCETDEPLGLVPLAHPLGPNGAREHYMRARLNSGAVAAAEDQDSSLISTLAKSDCLIVRPVNAPALPMGRLVPVISLEF
jgi:molybdopterin molybdotransferase